MFDTTYSQNSRDILWFFLHGDANSMVVPQHYMAVYLSNVSTTKNSLFLEKTKCKFSNNEDPSAQKL